MSLLKETLRDYRIKVIFHYLEIHGGNRTRAALDLGIDRAWICKLLKKHRDKAAT